MCLPPQGFSGAIYPDFHSHRSEFGCLVSAFFSGEAVSTANSIGHRSAYLAGLDCYPCGLGCCHTGRRDHCRSDQRAHVLDLHMEEPRIHKVMQR